MSRVWGTRESRRRDCDRKISVGEEEASGVQGERWGHQGKCRLSMEPGFSDEECLVAFSRVILMDRIKVLLS